ncbi:MAG: HlyD family secretion protein [Alphaproteobacteria bacterium]
MASSRRFSFSRRFVRLILLAVAPVAAALIGLYFYATGGRYISTENAYIKSDKVAISTDVTGRVVEVKVVDNQMVKAGDLLFRLDPEPFKLSLDEAEARVRSTRTEIEAMRAQYRQKQQELNKAEIDIQFAQTEFDRQQQLIKQGYASRSKFDAAQYLLNQSQQAAKAAREQMAEVAANLGGSPGVPIEQNPRYLQAVSKRDDAALDLRRVVVYAPIEGIVTRMTLQAGEHVERGTPVFSVVKATSMWVEANLKETELTYVRVGQPAKVTVDAYPGYSWDAKVESISPATGAEFSLLPPQNATGNWVKVVQRVPVRLAIEPRTDAPPLRAGISVVAEIDTGHERKMPSFISWIFKRE